MPVIDYPTLALVLGSIVWAQSGIWEGADGPLLDLWVDEDEVIALVGGASKRSLFTLER